MNAACRFGNRCVFFRERDDGDGRDGLFESGERRERPSRRRGREGVTVSGVTIVRPKTSSPSSRPSRPRQLKAISGQTAVRRQRKSPKVKAVLKAKKRGERPDSSLRRFCFQVTAKTAEPESGGESVREKAEAGARNATDCALNFPRQSG